MAIEQKCVYQVKKIEERFLKHKTLSLRRESLTMIKSQVGLLKMLAQEFHLIQQSAQNNSDWMTAIVLHVAPSILHLTLHIICYMNQWLLYYHQGYCPSCRTQKQGSRGSLEG